MSMKDFARTVIRLSADTMKKEEANFYASDMVWIDANPPFFLPQTALLVPITTAKYLIGSDEVAITLDSVKITKVYVSCSSYTFIWANVEQHDNTAGTGLATETVHTDGFIQTAEIPIRNGWKFSYGESALVTISNSDIFSPGHEMRVPSAYCGYTAGGYGATTYTAATEKYDDVANTWTTRTGLHTARYTTGFSLNEYGYTAGGSGATGNTAATEKYDDVTNIWTVKTGLNTSRRYLTGFELNAYGYTIGGITTVTTAITEKYDDVANTWTTKTDLLMYRYEASAFSLNGYGYTAGGYAFDITASTEKYDDVADTWTAKTGLNTARYALAGFYLNDYGYTAGGDTTEGGAVTAATEKYDDVANTWTVKTGLNTPRLDTSGFELNDYGYTAGGNTTGLDITAATEKYDDAANTWTAMTALNTARDTLAGFSNLIAGVDSHRYTVTLLGTAKPNMEDLRAKLEARGITI